MIKVIILIFSIGLIAEYNSQSQTFPVYNYEEFEHLLQKNNDTLYIINFWATWCKPCIEEMPAFNKVYDEYNDKKVKIILVNLDFGKSVQQRISTFKDKHQLRGEIIILDDPDGNSWINKVHSSWSGGIPATVIYKGKDYNFYEQSFHYNELKSIIQSKL